MRPTLVAITPPGPQEIPRACVDAWMRAGARPETLVVLLRDPQLAASELLDARLRRFARLRAACAEAGILVLIACPAAAALAVLPRLATLGLAGIQVQGDPPPTTLAAITSALDGFVGSPAAPQRLLLGRSCHGIHPPGGDASVDYTVLAPIFPPRTPPTKPAVGLAAIAPWAAMPGAHVVALGGVCAATAAACVAAGARGLASISAFFGEPAAVHEDVAALTQSVRAASHGSKTRQA